MLALSRIIASPVLLWLLIYGESITGFHITWINYFAAVLFGLASMTDFFDGYVARLWNASTKLGGIIDPLADKMLMLAAFLALMEINRASPWAIYLILSREFFITGIRVMAAGSGKDVSASALGKYKTGLQIAAVFFLIMQWPFGTLLLWLAVIITLYSGYEYIRAYY
jgi:CDP-diacylglycerol--glycerol-3-phosphate 3-phosphatidyltransferase